MTRRWTLETSSEDLMMAGGPPRTRLYSTGHFKAGTGRNVEASLQSTPPALP